MSADLLLAAFAGFSGALIMTIFTYIFIGMGINLDLPYLLGSRFVSIDKRNKVYLVGVILHLILGAIWGIIYVFFTTAMAVTPDWPIGLLYGFAHGIFMGAIVGTLSNLHPHVGEGKQINDPGMFGINWGAAVPYILILLHLIFGVVTMITYDTVYRPEQMPRM